jgi:hypothetical protein
MNCFDIYKDSEEVVDDSDKKKKNVHRFGDFQAYPRSSTTLRPFAFRDYYELNEP